jgi:hypothetical protein
VALSAENIIGVAVVGLGLLSLGFSCVAVRSRPSRPLGSLAERSSAMSSGF